jgi:NMD protein affecting ribosome stability and mRNA decay
VCRACGFEPYDGLTEDGLCGACDKTVKDLEEGKI